MALDTKKLAELHEKILKFNAVRGWDPSAQNIAKSVVIEAAELLEHFQWDSQDYGPKEKNVEEIGYEMADVVWYLFLLAEKLNIDLVDSMAHKYEHNEQKYPAEMFKGKHNSEFYYAQKKKYREEKKK
jgi:dCTP diphosphatase